MIELKSRWSVVVPTNRREQYEKVFYPAWKPLFEKHDVQLFPVFDEPKTWRKLPWFIPRRTDMIRSWGFYEAWKAGSEYTLTLDDDVLPRGDVFAAYEYEFERPSVCSPYLSVGSLTTSSLQMRGFPYGDRAGARVAVQYGGWEGVLDYDAATQLACSTPSYECFSSVVLPVPHGVPATTCIMNAAHRTELAPLMWQLPMLDGKFNRFGDIWSGLIQKKFLDLTGEVMLVNGRASVKHQRASNAFANLEREAPGCEINETLWDSLGAVDGFEFAGNSATYRAITSVFASVFPEDYAQRFLLARDEWLELFGW